MVSTDIWCISAICFLKCTLNRISEVGPEPIYIWLWLTTLIVGFFVRCWEIDSKTVIKRLLAKEQSCWNPDTTDTSGPSMS